MLINKKKITKLLNTEKNEKFFDENFFMYLENDDLCKRIKDNKEKIFVVQDSKIKHYVFSNTFHTKVVRNAHGDSGGVRGAAWL